MSVGAVRPAQHLYGERHVDLDRLGISPQCGFSSSDKSNKIMSVEQATEKLALVVDVARKVWGD
jgi:5-methyltetrahydropteroyltriglutamate--homocysteine methyltransferase